MFVDLFKGVGISIHSLRAEGDCPQPCRLAKGQNFNPLPPCGGRRYIKCRNASVSIFQSTPSVRRETDPVLYAIAKAKLFQSTPSVRRETTYTIYHDRRRLFQSTPSVRRETFLLAAGLSTYEFQSTPSVRRETNRQT